MVFLKARTAELVWDLDKGVNIKIHKKTDFAPAVLQLWNKENLLIIQ